MGVYTGSEILKNLEKITSVYTGKIGRRRRKMCLYMYQTMGFTYKNRNNRKQNPLKLRLRRSKVIGSISTTINNDIIDKKPPPKAAKKIYGCIYWF